MDKYIERYERGIVGGTNIRRKWTVGEIVSHIMNWDDYLLRETLSSVRDGQGMDFPDFDTYNKLASNYAKSGISKMKLLEEAEAKESYL